MGEKRKILLHSCCGPCSTSVIERLADFYEITVLYYNPNIYPESEYLKRKSEQLRFIRVLNERYPHLVVKFLDHDYESEKFYAAVKGLEREPEGGARCPVCFRLRLEETARLAKNLGFDLFGTTLTVSPHKDADIINEIGNSLQNKYDIYYLKANFKKGDGYKRSIELSKQLDLYRQEYCGCEFALKKDTDRLPDEFNRFF